MVRSSSILRGMAAFEAPRSGILVRRGTRVALSKRMAMRPDARLRQRPARRIGVRPQEPPMARPLRTAFSPADPCGTGCRTAYRASHASLGPAGLPSLSQGGPRRRRGLPPRRPAPTHPLHDDGAAPGPLPGPLAAGQGAGRGARRDPRPRRALFPGPLLRGQRMPSRRRVKGFAAPWRPLTRRRDGADRRRDPARAVAPQKAGGSENRGRGGGLPVRLHQAECLPAFDETAAARSRKKHFGQARRSRGIRPRRTVGQAAGRRGRSAELRRAIRCRALRSSRIPLSRCRPSTRIPLPSHAAAAACLSTSVPPAIRRGRSPAFSRSGHGVGSHLCRARDLAPRPVALRPHAGPVWSGHAVLPRRSATAVEDAPPVARGRDVAHGAFGARRPRAAARLRRGTWASFGAATNAGGSVRQRPARRRWLRRTMAPVIAVRTTWPYEGETHHMSGLDCLMSAHGQTQPGPVRHGGGGHLPG